MEPESHNNISDLIGLKRLNDGSILHNLRLRFGEDEIYTSVGSILVSLNPFKILPIYTPEIVERYEQLGAARNPPHVFALADTAYRRLTSANVPQSCIVSGESGAGKTEATKLFLSYITAVSSRGVDVFFFRRSRFFPCCGVTSTEILTIAISAQNGKKIQIRRVTLVLFRNRFSRRIPCWRRLEMPRYFLARAFCPPSKLHSVV